MVVVQRRQLPVDKFWNYYSWWTFDGLNMDKTSAVVTIYQKSTLDGRRYCGRI